MVTVHNFSYGLLNPVLGYAMSCLGAFLGLRCITRARALAGFAKARWLALAAVSVGATGIWTMHFIAMLGFTIPGQEILYNVPVTIGSMLIAIAVVGVGLFIVGYGNGGWVPLLTGGVKTPKQVEVWPDLPRSRVGKVLKSEVRSRLLTRG